MGGITIKGGDVVKKSENLRDGKYGGGGPGVPTKKYAAQDGII